MADSRVRELLGELEKGINSREEDKAFHSIQELMKLNEKLFVRVKNIEDESYQDEDFRNYLQMKLEQHERENHVEPEQVIEDKEKLKNIIVDELIASGIDEALSIKIAQRSSSIREAKILYELDCIGVDEELAKICADESSSIKEAKQKYRGIVKGEVPIKKINRPIKNSL